MIAVVALALAQAPLTSEALVDAMAEKYGYGVIVSSVATMDPIAGVEAKTASDAAARIRNRWRIAPDAEMPGVWRADVAPYEDLFDEERFPRVKNGTAMMPPRLPDVSLAALERPGGVKIRVEQLVVLLQAQALRVPTIYGRRTVQVRIDPQRIAPGQVPDLVRLFAAITGGEPSLDRKTVRFDPTSYRKLAVATLSAEAQRTEFEGTVTRIGEHIAYWEQRPLRLAMGAAAYHAADDGTLDSLARTPQRAVVVSVARLKGQGGEIAAQLMEAYERNNARPPFRLERAEISDVPEIKVSNGSGLGRLGVRPQGSVSTSYL